MLRFTQHDKREKREKIMSTGSIKEIINQYFDNELSKSEEVILFTQLSQNNEAREYFKEMNILRTSIETLSEEYPENLDEKIFSQLKRETQYVKPKLGSTKIFSAISYSFAILLLALSFFFYNESIQYRNQLEATSQQVNQQNQMIKVLFNSLPQAEVEAKVENEIIVTSQM